MNRPWHSEVCGIGLETRRRLGLQGTIRIGQKTCSPACRAAYVARALA